MVGTKIFLFFSSVILLIIFFIFPEKADALALAPALVEVSAEPGETLVQNIGLFNETDRVLTIYPRVENFKPQPGTNVPQFLGDVDPFGAARWISLPFKKVVLKPGEKKSFFTKIKISALAEPGGHYAAILWAEEANKNVGIGVNSQLASLFLFKIKGDIKEEAKLVSFQKVGGSAVGDFLLRFENSGNVHLKPGGTIELINWYGRRVGKIDVNTAGASVMPQSQRQFFARWNGDFLWPGPYSAKVYLLYGESQKELSAKLNFWLWPEAAVAKIFGFIILAVLIFSAVRLAKKKTIIAILAVSVIFFPNYILAATTSTSGTATVSGEYTVSAGGGGGGGGTLPAPSSDTTPPAAIANLAIGSVATSSAHLSWTTPGDDDNTGTATRYNIKYSTSAITEANWTNATLVMTTLVPQAAGTFQALTVSGLLPNTTYYFALKTSDEKNNWSPLSNVVSATTLQESGLPPDTRPPVISSISVEPGIYTAKIIWHTNETADSQVAYGLTSELGELLVNNNFVTSHSVNLTGLMADTIYYFKVVSADAAGNQAVGLQNGVEIGQFQTLLDTVPPVNIGSFQAVGGDKEISLSWHNPPDNDFVGIMLLRSSDHYPTNKIGDFEVSYKILGTKSAGATFVDKKNLINGKTYYYTAYAFDKNKNAASGAMAQATPQAAAAPPPAGGEATQCSDKMDNDGDGYRDYPNDLGCANPQDNSELEEAAVPPTLPGESTPGIGGVGAITELQLSDFIFSVAKGQIIISSGYNIGTLIGSGLQIALPQTKVQKAADSIILNVAGGAYFFNLQNGKWQTEISAPTQSGSYQAVFIVNFSDQTKNIISWQLDAKPYGQIYEKTVGQKKPLAGATALLLQNGAPWPAGNFYQSNPQLTAEDGLFGFLVPAGNYFLQIEKNGYTAEKIALNISGVIVNPNVELIYVPPAFKDVIEQGIPLVENLQNVAQNLGEKAEFVGKKINKEISQGAQKAIGVATKIIKNQEAQKIAEQVAAPVITGAAAAAATATVGWTSFLNYLRFLFTQPALLFKRRKRKNWGIVYNSLTKLPLGLMTVRLIDAESGRIVQSRVTDGEGRYAFFPAIGSYKLEIFSDQFDFPSRFFGGLREDGRYLDLYHGEVIEIREKGATITANVPLDPIGAERPVGSLIWQLIWRRIQHALSIISLFLAIGFAIWLPSFITIGLLAVQIGFYALFRHLAIPSSPKNWGIIYDEKTSLPLVQAIARIFDRQYNKLLETQITDKSGRYAFLVGRNEYYVTYEKNGYEKKQSKMLDLKNSSEPVSSIGVDTGLKPQMGDIQDVDKDKTVT